MRRVKYRFLLCSLALCMGVTYSFSQGKAGYFVGGGLMYYNGDLGDKANKVFTKTDFFHPYVSVGASYWLTGHLEATIVAVHGKVDGADSLSEEKNNRQRNLSFESDIDELSLRFEINSLHRYMKSRMNVYLFGGISGFHFNPKAELDGTWHNLQPLGTEGQFIPGGGYEKPYELYQAAVPIGFGFVIQLSRHFRLKTEFCHHILFTDYLDDLSTVYPDLESLLATPNGELAAQLSSRKLNGKYPKENSPRGSAKYKDTYTSFGCTLVYNPGYMQCPSAFKTTKIKRTKY